jgi:hypothetical protein
MSTAKENLTRLNAILGSGKDGYIAGMNDASVYYKSDSSISPLDFTDLNRRQMVVQFGGYLVAHKGLSADYVYGFADAIYAKSDKINLKADTNSIKAQLTSLDDALSAENEESAAKKLMLGDTGEALGKSINARISQLTVAFAAMSNPTPRMVDSVITAIKELEALLPQGAVVATPNQEKALVNA